MYVRIYIFNCINASMNDCKLVPSVPGFATARTVQPVLADFIGKSRHIILEEGVFIGALGLIGTNWD